MLFVERMEYRVPAPLVLKPFSGESDKSDALILLVATLEDCLREETHSGEAKSDEPASE